MVQLKTRVFYKEKRTEKPETGRNWVLLGIVSLQGFLTLSLFNMLFSALYSFAEFILGLNLLAFAGFLYLYFNGKKKKSDDVSLNINFNNDEKAYLG